MATFATGTITSFISNKICVRSIFLTCIRNRFTDFKGYYKRKLHPPLFEKRKADYRKNVLRPLEEISTLEDRLKAMNEPDPVLDIKIDIGFALQTNRKVSVKSRLEWHKKVASFKLKSAVGEMPKVNLSDVHKDWLERDGPAQLRNIADHYGIFKDLYDHGVFTPNVVLNISYDFDENSVNPVCTGNILQSIDASKIPNVEYASNAEDLWTLVLTNLDGHLLDTNSEYLHWFIGNIKGSDLKSGEVVYDYLRPFPIRGTGYHRLVFVLYKQDKKIDYSALKKSSPCVSLKERTFKTFDFYKEYQDFLTPAGLAFFQCTWDESLTDFFHNVLNMQEPTFEYIQPPIYYKPQVQFPHKEPFNLYLDRYRDPKEIEKDVLLKRLQTVEPFKEDPPMPKYPCLHKPDGYEFSWQRQDFRLQRLRQAKYRGLRPHSIYPQTDNEFPYWTKA